MLHSSGADAMIRDDGSAMGSYQLQGSYICEERGTD
jgi:hypothetical protein